MPTRQRAAGREHVCPDFRAGHRHHLLDLHLRLEPERPIADAERGNDVYENHVPLRHRGNDYPIDRKPQKTKNYTGILGMSEQDAAVQASQGPSADRTHEHRGRATSASCSSAS